jgi:phage gp36-like protein
MAYPYATIDDVFARFPVSTLVGSSDNEVSSFDVSSIFIADAQGIVDSFLAARYVTPVTVEPLITHITADLAIFNMLAERTGRVPQVMQARYDRSMTFLMALRDGDMYLNPNSQTFNTSLDQFAWSTTQDYHPTFSPVLGELDQAADSDWIDADKDDRSGD